MGLIESDQGADFMTATRLILTNDDGIDAPGLAALAKAAVGLGEWRIVAPLGECSGGSHGVTTHKPIRLERRQDGSVGVGGTPADCVRLTLHHLEPSIQWVLSGINAGGNLGGDLHHSATAAAAREAALRGVPAVAISHYRARGLTIDWNQAARWTALVLADLLARPWAPGTFWNVNLPHQPPGGPEPDIVFCRADPSPLPLSYRWEGETATYDADYHGRARLEGGDVAVCFGGRIAVSLVAVGPG